MGQGQVGELFAAVFFHFLVDGLAPAGGLQSFVGLDKAIVLALDLDFEPGLGERIFEGEVGEIAVYSRAGRAPGGAIRRGAGRL